MKAHRKIDGLDIAIVHPIYSGTERRGSTSDYKDSENGMGMGTETVSFGFGPKTRHKLTMLRQEVRYAVLKLGSADKYVGGNYFIPTDKLPKVMALEDEFRKKYRAILDSAEDVLPELKETTKDWDFFFHITLFGLTEAIETRAQKMLADSLDETIKSMEKKLTETKRPMMDETRTKYHEKIDEVLKLTDSPIVQNKLRIIRTLVETKTKEEAERQANITTALVEAGQKLYDQIIEAQAAGWISDELTTAMSEYQKNAAEIGQKYGLNADPKLKELVDNLKSLGGK